MKRGRLCNWGKYEASAAFTSVGPVFSSRQGGQVSEVGAKSNISESELAAWLAFAQIAATGGGLTARKILSLYEHLGSLDFAWKANRDQLRFVPGLSADLVEKLLVRRAEIDPASILESVRAEGISAYPLVDDRYPSLLKQIHDPPCVLYMRGRLTAGDMSHSAAVVGTRRPTAYGQRLAKEIAGTLAERGVTVVSGMAIGIDSFAHRAAIDAGGKTVAVLGCGPDVCYPSSNRPLYEMLVSGKHGAVLSEYFPGTKPDKWRFPARNRIIAGLAQAVIVVEASETSGSLITARMAFEQNREVFAVPGRVDSPMSRGTNQLIVRHTAQLMETIEDVFTTMRWASASSGGDLPTVVQLFGREKEVYDIITSEPVHFDMLVDRLGIPVPELSAALTMLELANLVERLPGEWYSRL